MVHFKIKRHTKLKKLMEAYCLRQGLVLAQVRFLFDGARLRDTQTPDELDMEDDDVIDAMPSATVIAPQAGAAGNSAASRRESAAVAAEAPPPPPLPI